MREGPALPDVFDVCSQLHHPQLHTHPHPQHLFSSPFPSHKAGLLLSSMHRMTTISCGSPRHNLPPSTHSPRHITQSVPIRSPASSAHTAHRNHSSHSPQ